jgi:hypothetical protein
MILCVNLYIILWNQNTKMVFLTCNSWCCLSEFNFKTSIESWSFLFSVKASLNNCSSSVFCWVNLWQFSCSWSTWNGIENILSNRSYRISILLPFFSSDIYILTLRYFLVYYFNIRTSQINPINDCTGLLRCNGFKLQDG